MSKRLIGMLAGVALLGSGVAFAGDDHKKKDQQAQSSESSLPQDSQDNMGSTEPIKGDDASGIGGSGSEGVESSASGTAEGTRSEHELKSETELKSESELGTGGSGKEQAKSSELTGKVIKAQGQQIWVDHMGAVVELWTNSKTQFEGEAKRVRDLKEGDEIRASFEVKNRTANLAKSIEKSQGVGGSGFEDVGSSTEGGLDNTGSLEGESGSGLEGGATEEPLPGTGGSGLEGSGSMPEEGTGGAGLEGETPDTMGTEPSDDLGTQTGSDPASESQPESSPESGSQVP